MDQAQNLIDEWLLKIGRIFTVFVQGAKETAEEHGIGILPKTGSIQSTVEEVGRKGKEVTKKVISGVNRATNTDVELTRRRIDAIANPGRNVLLFTTVTGLAAATGLTVFFALQERKLRRLLRRGVSESLNVDVPDGLVGPVGDVHRPLVAELCHAVRGVAAAGFKWGGVSTFAADVVQAVARPTSSKLVYHGVMFLCHATAFAIRLRYYRVQSLVAAQRNHDLDSELDGVEQFVFDAALKVKCFFAGTAVPPKLVVTGSSETVPYVALHSLVGSSVMGVWHGYQLVRCFSARRRLSLRSPPPQTGVLSTVIRAIERVSQVLEPLVLTTETALLAFSSVHLAIGSNTSTLTATAMLRLGLVTRLLATRHRIFDDSENTLHAFQAVDRRALYLHAVLLMIQTAVRPRTHETAKNLVLAVAFEFAAANLFHTVKVFAFPRHPRNGAASISDEMNSVDGALYTNVVAQLMAIVARIVFPVQNQTRVRTQWNDRFTAAQILLLVTAYVASACRAEEAAVSSPSAAPPPPPSSAAERPLPLPQKSASPNKAASGEDWDQCDPQDAPKTLRAGS